jgi:hypothetical protein
VLWSRGQNGTPGDLSLFDDGARFGALRLTVDHHYQRDAGFSGLPGAALWVRVGTGLTDERQFDDWLSEFCKTKPDEVKATEQVVRLQAPTPAGPVRLAAAAPFGQGGEIELAPEPTRGTLEIDGQEVGRPILERLECVKRHLEKLETEKVVIVPADRGVYWEAEAGLVFPGMQVGEDAGASRGRFVWQSPASSWDQVTGTVRWTLKLAEAGRYYFWGRVWAPDLETDSFFVTLSTATSDLVARADWHTTSGAGWRWVPLALNRARQPTVFELPAGEIRLQLTARESGTKIDRLFVARTMEQTP